MSVDSHLTQRLVDNIVESAGAVAERVLAQGTRLASGGDLAPLRRVLEQPLALLDAFRDRALGHYFLVDDEHLAEIRLPVGE